MTHAPDHRSNAPRSRTLGAARAGLSLLFSAVALSGCTLVNGPSSEPSPRADPSAPGRVEAVSRSFGGQLSVQGSTFPVVLALTIRGEEVEDARLTVPELSMEARGNGSLRDGRLELELEYGDDCEGRVRITGDMEEAGYRFRGMLAARDCTGSEEGALVLHLGGG